MGGGEVGGGVGGVRGGVGGRNVVQVAHQGRILMMMENSVEPSRVATMATDGCVKVILGIFVLFYFILF